MRGVCTGLSAPDCRVRRLNVEASEPRTDMFVLGCHPLAYQIRVHKNCIHNQHKALVERHIKDRTYIPFVPEVWRRAARAGSHYIRTQLGNPLTPVLPAAAIPNYYTGGKRRIYERAVEYLKTGDLLPKHYRVSMFVKPDKHPLCKIMDKAPRAIQFRSPHFNVRMMQYLRPIEHLIYTLRTVDGARIFAKGRSPQQRAEDILYIQSLIDDCCYISADHAKFDSCIRVEHLKSTHKFYKQFNRSGYLRHLLSRQLRNRGYSKFLRYVVEGTRMSGDFDTALGNSFINFCVLYDMFQELKVKAYFYIDGDDSIIFISRRDLERVDLDCSRYGFETEFEVNYELSDVVFCKTRLIRSDPPNMVRDPRAVLSGLAVCLGHYHPTVWPSLLQGKIKCEIYANQGAPGIVGYLSSLVNQVEAVISRDDLYKWSQVRHHQLARVTPLAIVDYYSGWSIDPGFEIMLKTPQSYCQFRKLTGNTGGTTKRFKYVLKSVLRAWQGYQSLDGSPDLCCGASCKCSRAWDVCESKQPATSGRPHLLRSTTSTGCGAGG